MIKISDIWTWKEWLNIFHNAQKGEEKCIVSQ